MASFSIDLNTVMQELFKVSTIEDAIGSRLGVVDHEFVFGRGIFGCGCFRLVERKGDGVSLLRR